MSIADKLTTIAENIQQVYEAGVRDGQQSGGGDGEFWDNFQNGGNRTVYTYAFYQWPDSCFYPKYNIVPETTDGPNGMFYWSDIQDIAARLDELGISIDLSKCPRLSNTFYRCSSKSLPVIDMASCTSTHTTFQYMRNLTDLTIVNLRADCTFTNTFSTVTGLVNLSITGTIGQNGFNLSSCSQLTHESLINVLNILEDKTSDTSGTAWKVTLGTTNLNKLTSDEKAIATNKGWELA